MEALALGDGRLELDLGLVPGEIRFERLALSSNEIDLSVHGLMRSPGEKDPYVELGFETSFVPLLTLWKYIPPKTLKASAFGTVIKGVKEGELRLNNAQVRGRL